MNVWLLGIGACFGLIARLSNGKTALLECRGIELVNDAGATLPIESVSVVKKDNGALQLLKAGDALIERKFMPVDGGFRVEEQFKKLPSSALNRWNSSYAPGFANTWNYTPSVGGLVPDTYSLMFPHRLNGKPRHRFA